MGKYGELNFIVLILEMFFGKVQNKQTEQYYAYLLKTYFAIAASCYIYNIIMRSVAKQLDL